MERLNTEVASRVKRERRRANEIKSKTIRRMQLHMTTPLDIGLEQTDLSLRDGLDDILDLEDVMGMDADHKSTPEQACLSCDSSVEEDDSGTDERQKRLLELEAELDGLYDGYQERLRERDESETVVITGEKRKRPADVGFHFLCVTHFTHDF
jgi:AdoMet-dependent rRNA methyltransferase SPB1